MDPNPDLHLWPRSGGKRMVLPASQICVTGCQEKPVSNPVLGGRWLIPAAILVLVWAAVTGPLVRGLGHSGGTEGGPVDPAPPGVIALFEGKDLSGWVTKDGRPASWKVRDGYLEVIPGTGDIMTREEFGDCELHVEFWIPLMPDKAGQAHGNSGISCKAAMRSRYSTRTATKRTPTAPVGPSMVSLHKPEREQASGAVAELRHHLPLPAGR